MTQDRGESNNQQFSGFVRPSPEALQALSGSLEETVRSYFPVLSEKPTNLRVVSHYFWGALLSGNLDHEFTVNYAALSEQFNVGSESIRVAVREAVQSGYLKMLVIGNRGKPSLYKINWRETTAAEK